MIGEALFFPLPPLPHLPWSERVLTRDLYSHVAAFVSNPKLEKRKISRKVATQQVGPTILKALGLDPRELKGVVAEGTEVLEGF
jgi:hypothetical protein